MGKGRVACYQVQRTLKRVCSKGVGSSELLLLLCCMLHEPRLLRLCGEVLRRPHGLRLLDPVPRVRRRVAGGRVVRAVHGPAACGGGVEDDTARLCTACFMVP